MSIDRERLVRRHNVRHTAPDAIAPLTVGNGEFAFTVDITGLQSFPGFHDPRAARREGREVMPLATQSQWGFHTMPNPEGYSLEDVMASYASPHGDVDYPVKYDFRKDPDELGEDERAGYWLWVNPQRIDLGRLGLELRTTPDAAPSEDIAEVTEIDQELDLWTGQLSSRFAYGGEAFTVRTACHPTRDLIAVRIESAALRDGRATLRLQFPYASDTFAETAEWNRPEAHSTDLTRPDAATARFARTLDDDGYVAEVAFTPGARLDELGGHAYRVRAHGLDALDLVLAFSATSQDELLPGVDETFAEAAAGWLGFWVGGAAVDFDGSADPRAHELERRVILAQYNTRTQCAGSMPSAETGLVQNSWAGKFHLEMHWWHAAHFAMWGRSELLERSFAWYLGALPVAKQIAQRQGYQGARWPKHVGPEGRESPNEIGPLLAWQQPHPIHLAELIRRARPEGEAEVLARYGEVVEESAMFIASFLTRGEDGLFHLTPPIMPAQECYEPSSAWDPTFELAYFWWGLDVAQQWREHAGRERSPEWDGILASFAPLPVGEDGYAAIGNPPRTILSDHPSMLAALGVVPRTPLVDDATMRRTLDFVVKHWEWDSAWGWDFPVLAMCATRVGEPELAVGSLMMDSPRNRYLANGHNCQDPMRLPLYLPGNGGLLAAVALMAAGWSGGGTELPGFPHDGTWTVRYEGFSDRP